MALSISPTRTEKLLPGLPVPETAYLNLAAGWVEAELVRRRTTSDDLSDEQLDFAQSAAVLKALALKASIGGAVAIEASAAKKVIEQIKVVGQMEIKYSLGQPQPLLLASTQWEQLAEQMLRLALPSVPTARRFPGVAR